MFDRQLKFLPHGVADSKQAMLKNPVNDARYRIVRVLRRVPGSRLWGRQGGLLRGGGADGQFQDG